MRQLVKLKLKSGTSITKHINEFDNLVNQLSTIELQLEEEQAFLLLSSLPESRKKQVAFFSNLTPNSNLTIAMVTDALFNGRLRERM